MTDAMKPEELWSTVAAKTFEVMRHWAEAQQRVAREMVNLTAATTTETVRMYTELQASTLEALRHAQTTWVKQQADVGANPMDPAAWYQRMRTDPTHSTQTALRLMDASAQTLTKGAERVQAAMYTTSKNVQDTFDSLVAKMQATYASA